MIATVVLGLGSMLVTVADSHSECPVLSARFDATQGSLVLRSCGVWPPEIHYDLDLRVYVKSPFRDQAAYLLRPARPDDKIGVAEWPL